MFTFQQSPHAVQVFRIVDTHIPASAPAVTTEHPSDGNVGATLKFAAHGEAVVSFHWDFGDGVSQEGREVNHTYTEPGQYNVSLTVTGLSGATAGDHFQVSISGRMPTTFDPHGIKRYRPMQ